MGAKSSRPSFGSSMVDYGCLWVEDEHRAACFHCEGAFHALSRRHHCRACGELYCATEVEVPTKVAGETKPTRTCWGHRMRIPPNLLPPPVALATLEVLVEQLQAERTRLEKTPSPLPPAAQDRLAELEWLLRYWRAAIAQPVHSATPGSSPKAAAAAVARRRSQAATANAQAKASGALASLAVLLATEQGVCSVCRLVLTAPLLRPLAFNARSLLSDRDVHNTFTVRVILHAVTHKRANGRHEHFASLEALAAAERCQNAYPRIATALMGGTADIAGAQRHLPGTGTGSGHFNGNGSFSHTPVVGTPITPQTFTTADGGSITTDTSPTHQDPFAAAAAIPPHGDAVVRAIEVIRAMLRDAHLDLNADAHPADGDPNSSAVDHLPVADRPKRLASDTFALGAGGFLEMALEQWRPFSKQTRFTFRVPELEYTDDAASCALRLLRVDPKFGAAIAASPLLSRRETTDYFIGTPTMTTTAEAFFGAASPTMPMVPSRFKHRANARRGSAGPGGRGRSPVRADPSPSPPLPPTQQPPTPTAPAVVVPPIAVAAIAPVEKGPTDGADHKKTDSARSVPLPAAEPSEWDDYLPSSARTFVQDDDEAYSVPARIDVILSGSFARKKDEKDHLGARPASGDGKSASMSNLSSAGFGRPAPNPVLFSSSNPHARSGSVTPAEAPAMGRPDTPDPLSASISRRYDATEEAKTSALKKQTRRGKRTHDLVLDVCEGQGEVVVPPMWSLACTSIVGVDVVDGKELQPFSNSLDEDADDEIVAAEPPTSGTTPAGVPATKAGPKRPPPVVPLGVSGTKYLRIETYQEVFYLRFGFGSSGTNSDSAGGSTPVATDVLPPAPPGSSASTLPFSTIATALRGPSCTGPATFIESCAVPSTPGYAKARAQLDAVANPAALLVAVRRAVEVARVRGRVRVSSVKVVRLSDTTK